MKIINAEQVEQQLSFRELITLLKQGFSRPFTMPMRQVYHLGVTASLTSGKSNCRDGFALLPAWNDEVIATKAFTYFPENEQNHRLASLFSQILLFSRQTGEPLALIDGTRITYWRTAAVSALASSLLSRENSRHLLLFGTGQLAPYLLHAHLTVRKLNRITLWGRNAAKVQALIETFRQHYPDVDFAAAASLADEVNAADIICCATGAETPLFDGQWLSPGTHVDCLGNHLKDARECDAVSISRAGVYVDSRDNCLNEAGELLLAMQEGHFTPDKIRGELSQMCTNPEILRREEKEITLFKSVGTAISDLLTAGYVYKAMETGK